MDALTSGRALAGGVVATISSVSYAAIRDDFFPVTVGAALGVIGLGWAIYRAANDQRFETILKRLDKAEAEVDEYRDKVKTVGDEFIDKLKVVNDNLIATNLRLSEVSGNYDLLKKRLSTHVCPQPADAAMKCTLPDIINITL